MPVMGPNCEYAKEQAIEAHAKIVEMLKNEYHLTFSKDIIAKNPDRSKLFKDFGVTDEQNQKLQDLLVDIFVYEACSTW